MHDLIYLVKVQTICPKCGRVRMIEQITHGEKIVFTCICNHNVAVLVVEAEDE